MASWGATASSRRSEVSISAFRSILALSGALVAALQGVASAGAAETAESTIRVRGLTHGIAATIVLPTAQPPGDRIVAASLFLERGGPAGTRESIRLGLKVVPGGSQLAYLETTKRDILTSRPLTILGGQRREHRLALSEIRGRPGFWNATIDGKSVSKPVHVGRRPTLWRAGVSVATSRTPHVSSAYYARLTGLSIARNSRSMWIAPRKPKVRSNSLHRVLRTGIANYMIAPAVKRTPTPVPSDRPEAQPGLDTAPTTNASPVGAADPARAPGPTTLSTPPPQESAPALSAPVAQPSAYAGRIGMGGRMFWYSENGAFIELQRLRAGGIDWVREGLLWDWIEPSPGVFDWSRSDNLMAAAARADVNVLALLTFSPRWASSDPSGNGDRNYPPRDPNQFAAYARAVVERYGQGGSFWAMRRELRPRPLTAVEIWNEPYGRWAWKPDPDPGAYAKLVRATAAAIRSVQPEIKVLVSGDILQARRDGSIVEWLDKLLTVDPQIHRVVNAWSVHPYAGPRSPYDATTDRRFSYRRVVMTDEVAKARGAARPIWITEIGWTTATETPDGVPEATQAAYTRDAVIRAISEWGAIVERIFVFSWDLSNGVPTDAQGNYGLRRADDSAKPAFGALTALLRSG